MAITIISVHRMDKCGQKEKCLGVYVVQEQKMNASNFLEDNSIFNAFCWGFERNLFHHVKNIEFLKTNSYISGEIILVNLDKLLDISFLFDSLQSRENIPLENVVVLTKDYESIFYVKANILEIFDIFDSHLATLNLIEFSNLYLQNNLNFTLKKICHEGDFSINSDDNYKPDVYFTDFFIILRSFSHMMDRSVKFSDLKKIIKHIVFCPICSTIAFKAISNLRPDVKNAMGLHGNSELYYRDWFISYGFYDLGLHYLVGDSNFLDDGISTLDRNLIRIFSYFDFQVGLSDAALNFSQNLTLSKGDLSVEHVSLPAPAPLRKNKGITVIHSPITENISKARWNFFVLGLDQVHIIDDFMALSSTDRVNFVAYYFWELLDIPSSYLESLSKFSFVIAPSKFIKQINDRGLNTNCLILPPTKIQSTNSGIVGQPNSLELLNLQDYYLLVFDFNSDFDRKNIEDTINVFNQFFKQTESKSILVIKSINSDKNPLAMNRMSTLLESSQKIIHISKNYSRVDMQFLLSKAKCLISLHRSEGFGLNVLEAMSIGIPVISTGFGGTTDFTDGYEIQIPFDLVSTKESRFSGSFYSEYDSYWAQPDLKVVLEYLQRIESSNDFRSEMTRQGLSLSKLFYQQTQFSYQKFVDELVSTPKFTKFIKWAIGSKKTYFNKFF
jgi:glycosyltransferase involved in cell wall biosynthesis